MLAMPPHPAPTGESIAPKIRKAASADPTTMTEPVSHYGTEGGVCPSAADMRRLLRRKRNSGRVMCLSTEKKLK
jgi:hypothetical protein